MRSFKLFVVCDAGGLAADSVRLLALTWFLIQSHSAVGFAAYVAITTVASGVGLFLFAPLADRFDKRRVLLASTSAACIELILLALLMSAGEPPSLALIVALGVLNSFAGSLSSAVAHTLAAELVGASKLGSAIGFQRAAESAARLTGPLIGGVLVASHGSVAALLVSFVLSVFTLLGFAALKTQARAKPRSAAGLWHAELTAGALAKWKIVLERYWTLASLAATIFFVPCTGMLVPLRLQELGLTAAWLGACQAALAGGILLGALGLGKSLAERLGRTAASVGSICVQGACALCIGILRDPVAICALFVVLGVAVCTVQMIGQTHRILAIPEQLRARMSAFNSVLMMGGGAIGGLLAGASTESWSAGTSYVWFGAGLSLVGLLYLAIPGYRSFLAMDPTDVVDFYARSDKRIAALASSDARPSSEQ